MKEEKYDYRTAVKNDIKNYINDNIDLEDYKNYDDLEEDLYEELWECDSVTGNESGSYTFNTYKAESYLCHNWDLLEEALEEFGVKDLNILEKGAEYCDVTIRCYLLPSMISEVIEEMESEYALEERDDER